MNKISNNTSSPNFLSPLPLDVNLEINLLASKVHLLAPYVLEVSLNQTSSYMLKKSVSIIDWAARKIEHLTGFKIERRSLALFIFINSVATTLYSVHKGYGLKKALFLLWSHPWLTLGVVQVIGTDAYQRYLEMTK